MFGGEGRFEQDSNYFKDEAPEIELGKGLPVVQFSDVYILADMSDVPPPELKKFGASSACARVTVMSALSAGHLTACLICKLVGFCAVVSRSTPNL